MVYSKHYQQQKERKMSNLIENLDGEVWKDLVGFDEYKGLYQISNLGRVKRLSSLNRDTTRKTRLPECILTPYLSGLGHLHVRLCLNGVNKRVLVHRLVALAFVEGDTSLVVNHKNFDKADNRASNLEWVTNAYNLSYTVTREWRFKPIPKERIEFWRSLLEQGYTLTQLQKRHGASMVSVRRHLPEFFN